VRSQQRSEVGDRTSTEIIARSIAGLRSIRRELGEVLAGVGWPRQDIADAQLVIAELATNAFVHDAAPTFSAAVACSPHHLEMSTSHPGRVLPPAPPVTPPDGSEPGGNGLVIVDGIVDERMVSSRSGVTSTYVRMSR
jgi:anti-sigma regulatory factor (Ser/Thr protein kinase)